MAEPPRERPAILPKVSYADPAAALEWLVRVFGFTETFRMAAPDGAINIAGVSTPGGGSLLVSGMPSLELMRSRFPQLRDPVDAGWPNRTYAITVMVPDVDAHFARAVAEGATVTQRPTDQPWGLRDYEVVDLDDRWWNFSQELNAVEPEDWGATRSGGSPPDAPPPGGSG
jgi:uncharacterized glyoxalase superfamily protein PhnB